MYNVLEDVLRKAHEVQGRDGNWNASSYNLGLFNGLEALLATLEHREPQLRKLPEGRGYIDLQFQSGPIGENGVNGCQIEDVINVLVERLEGFQSGPFKCRENALAITKLEEARLWLNERTRKRREQGVEGKNIPHQ